VKVVDESSSVISDGNGKIVRGEMAIIDSYRYGKVMLQ